MENNNSLCEVYIRIDRNGELDTAGEHILFGFYPQHRVEDDALISALNGLAGELPTNGSNGAWTSYKYYIFSDNDDDFMWYIDVEREGMMYRGVYFTSYRPYDTGEYQSTYESSHQGKNGYLINTVYWFKYEPIKWDILEEVDGKAWIIANLCIDSQAYRNVVWDNSYVNSSIRTWLNDDFINTAFDECERAAISAECVTNPIEIEYSDDEDGEVKYGGGDTFERIHLLSIDEAADMIQKGERQSTATDYAKCQGIIVNSENGNSVWWLRSPYESVDAWAQLVGSYGFCDFSTGETCNTDTGVRPALWLKL